MEDLHWPLTVLVKAIEYKNMTGAAQNIGISQPQISRLVSKIELSLSMTLIDRSSPRSSAWTAQARRLAQIYQQSTRKLEHALINLKEDQFPKTLSIGTLEGLSPMAIQYAQSVLTKTRVIELHLDVYDQNEMESKYLMGDLDLIFTSRPIGAKKNLYHKTLGYQRFTHFDDEEHTYVLSPFEFGTLKKTSKTNSEDETKVFISNSLALRSNWFAQYGGQGQLPGAIVDKPSKENSPVLAIAQDYFHKDLWQLLSGNVS